MKFWQALKALDEGRKVEFKPKLSGWGAASQLMVMNYPRWSTDADEFFDFRLVTEPIDGWVNIYAVGTSTVFESEDEADSRAMCDRLRCAHVREVVE